MGRPATQQFPFTGFKDLKMLVDGKKMRQNPFEDRYVDLLLMPMDEVIQMCYHKRTHCPEIRVVCTKGFGVCRR
jgi:hypothetical protein